MRITSQETLSNLATFMQYASVAYCDFSVIADWNCGIGCESTPGTRIEKLINSQNSDTQGYIAINDAKNLIVVAFRGTQLNQAKDISTIINILLTEYPGVKGAKVHQGFLNAFQSVKEEIFQIVQSLLNKNPKFNLAIVGHSLGGAIAVLEALDLKQRISSLISNQNYFVYTYGQPRIGNTEFANYVDSKILMSRIIHTVDLVPHIPPRLFGYQHSSGEIWIQSDANDMNCCVLKCDGQENKECSNSIPFFEQTFQSHHDGPYFGVTVHDC
ncbi:hypothetical protein G9A89_018456 [Geosiphon pyriformis]|nr:hypothetical protein G9A89_018456 [Geosiphon pyriformis]